MIDWAKLIQERDEWVAHNFPHSPTPDGSILGMIEELGELAHAHLKQEQNIRGDAEKHELDAQDAIGDLTIYMLGVLSFLGRNAIFTRPTPVITDARGQERQYLKWLAQGVGTVACHTEAHDCDRVVSLLRRYCGCRMWNYDEIVNETWNRVKERDWIANPKDGSVT